MIQPSSYAMEQQLNEKKRLLADMMSSRYEHQSKKQKLPLRKGLEGEVAGEPFEKVFLQQLKNDLNEVSDEARFNVSKKKKSVVWNFFTLVDSEETKDRDAKCNFCCTEVPRPNGSTSRLSDHLKKHKLIFQEFQRLKNLKDYGPTDFNVSQQFMHETSRDSALDTSEESFNTSDESVLDDG